MSSKHWELDERIESKTAKGQLLTKSEARYLWQRVLRLEAVIARLRFDIRCAVHDSELNAAEPAETPEQ